MSLAAASRARGLLWLALIMAAEWVAVLSVWFAEQATGADLGFINPAIDGVVVLILMTIALRPDFPGRSIYLWIVFLLTLQALTRLGLTVALPDWVRFVLNRMFEVIWLSIMAYAGARLVRIHWPETWRRVIHREGAERRSLMGEWASYALYRLFLAIHNDDRPHGEKIAPEPKSTKKPIASTAKTRPKGL